MDIETGKWYTLSTTGQPVRIIRKTTRVRKNAKYLVEDMGGVEFRVHRSELGTGPVTPPAKAYADIHR